jgi:hypothetical protein
MGSARLQPRHGGGELRTPGVVELCRDLLAALQIGQGVDKSPQQLRVIGGAQIMPVDILQLGEIEARRRAMHLRKIEGVDHFLRREKFLVTLAPAEPHQIIAQRLGQIAHGAIGVDAERAMALRELRAVGAVNERNMSEGRSLPAHRLDRKSVV